MLSHPPKIIGICGPPGHGKSTVQGFLSAVGVVALDDGLPIRLDGMKRFGVTWEQVSTQAGKIEMCEAFGETMEVRDMLGRIGLEHEDEDPNYWAEQALTLLRENGDGRAVSFGSVRRSQGSSYARRGGLVLEVFDPRKPESKYAFDAYDKSLAGRTIFNEGTLLDLEIKTYKAVLSFFSEHSETPSW